jgi:hypothetical protein
VHQDVPKIKKEIIAAGSAISKDTFSFPGREIFQFINPLESELLV